MGRTTAAHSSEPLESGRAVSVRQLSSDIVFWFVNTRTKALDLRTRAPDHFYFFKEGGGQILSGDVIRIRGSYPLDWLIADFEIDGRMVKVGQEFGPPRYRGTATFVIEHAIGERGRPLNLGDPIVLRGTRDNAWLCSATCNRRNSRISLIQNITQAELFATVAWDPPPPDPSPPPYPTPKPRPAPAPKQDAMGCVSPSLTGPVNTWKYSNRCDRRVTIIVSRTCHYRDGSSITREASAEVPARSEINFDRALKFGSFCASIQDTSYEIITRQFFVD
jgi:hypothetical protein